MCGICGIYNLDHAPIDIQLLKGMAKIVQYRGPDDEGYLLVNTKLGTTRQCYHQDTMPSVRAKIEPLSYDYKANLGFGFRRLSILDLSERGHQPMCNDDGTIWIVYNGEVYNYLELRASLVSKGYTFKSGTDTEVIIKAYEEWGENCLTKFNGMWSFVIWDGRKGKLFCARDRFGIKPFNYFFDGDRFIFGSELKQILLAPIDKKLNEKMIYRSMKINSILIYTDETYFEKVKVLPHGHFITIQDNNFHINKYYDLDVNTFENSKLNFEQAIEEYNSTFIDAVKLRMRSDVEVGSCLSGGLDSSAIVCIASKFSSNPLNTFSAFYENAPFYDERKWVNLISRETNIKTNFISPTPQNFLSDFSRMTFINDYPIFNSSAISQYFLMKQASSENVIVLLDGQGSDEITAGYNHAFYRYYADLLNSFSLVKFIKEFPSYLKYNQKGNKLSRMAKTLLVLLFKESTLYKKESKYNFINPLNGSFDDNQLFKDIYDLNSSKLSNFLYNLLMRTSIQTLLHLEDRNSMASSVETRVPFLDYRLVELTFSLPSHFKIYRNFGKYIHREALRKFVPVPIIERKDKVNFAAPGEAFWLRNELKTYLESVFNISNLRKRDIFNEKIVKNIYDDFLKGDKKQESFVWKLMALEKWFQVFVDLPLSKESFPSNN
jgi:asparagine synthase (glutamine-hydrolysing)